MKHGPVEDPTGTVGSPTGPVLDYAGPVRDSTDVKRLPNLMFPKVKSMEKNHIYFQGNPVLQLGCCLGGP